MITASRFSPRLSIFICGVWRSSIGGGPDCRVPVAAAPGRARRSKLGVALLGVELDDELLLHRRGDLPPLRPTQHLGREAVVVGLQPRGDLARELGRVGDGLLGRRRALDGDHVALPDLVARDVHAAAVDRPVPVTDELAGLAPGGGEAEADEHVVQAGLEHPQQVLARDAGLARGLVVVVAELLLEHAVVPAGLLLLAQLQAVLALLHAPAAVLAGRVVAPLDAALVGQAALALEEELLALAAALLALGRCVTRHGSQTLRRLRGRHPLWAWGVTSRTLVTSRPAAWRERIAVSRPEPGPLTKT